MVNEHIDVAKQIGEIYDIVPPQLAIKAMRSNGFKSTDHAIAELIDNSVQAGLQAGNSVTNVEVICVEKFVRMSQRQVKRIDEILVYDDAGGMPPDLLRQALMFGAGTNLKVANQKGIGKFGMGLPNASISQCRHVEVYSWQNGKCYLTYLDIPKILSGELREVPVPMEAEIPPRYLSLIKSKLSDGGTLVVWKDLDKTTWVRHQAFFRNSEFLIGRIYRRFIANQNVKIRFGAYDVSGAGQTADLVDELYVRPNDPLMLMAGTSAPDDYATDPGFEEYGQPDKVEVSLPDGTKSEVVIRYSVARQKTREGDDSGRAGGSTAIGKYVKRNVGVSVVRAGRELEMNTTWVNPSEPRDRWWGIEIEFQPELDEIFGVTNDKQAATNLYRSDYKEDADALELSPSELMEQLQETKDPKVANYRISQNIASRLKTIRKHIEGQKSGTRQTKEKKRRAEKTATDATNARKKTSSDIDFGNATNEQREEALRQAYLDSGYTEEHATQLAVEFVDSGIRYAFTEASLSSPAIFDLSSDRGEYFIKLNTKHPAYGNFIELLKEDGKDADSPALVALKLLLTAWARMEDEADDKQLELLQDVRIEWGKIARDFLRELGE
ncbi:ATP-binding protein [Falsiruegeria mediterranea]|uniref:ATP-binding protein n=1 Tax=Falsiruegeria mediterranea TaxID=1280832 RepID=UPI0015F26ECE|nr:ATP-binding protein [Falsiruegeria mediterranea]